MSEPAPSGRASEKGGCCGDSFSPHPFSSPQQPTGAKVPRLRRGTFQN